MSSVTVVHPAKATGWNEMPFGRENCVLPRNIVLNVGLEVTGQSRTVVNINAK